MVLSEEAGFVFSQNYFLQERLFRLAVMNSMYNVVQYNLFIDDMKLFRRMQFGRFSLHLLNCIRRMLAEFLAICKCDILNNLFVDGENGDDVNDYW